LNNLVQVELTFFNIYAYTFMAIYGISSRKSFDLFFLYLHKRCPTSWSEKLHAAVVGISFPGLPH